MSARMIDGINLIASERARQIAEEGFNTFTDMRLTKGELVDGAGAYACLHSSVHPDDAPAIAAAMWPPILGQFKPKTPLRDLVRAGALLAAEIDRRLTAGEKP